MSAPQTHDAADRARRLQRVAELLAEVVTPQEVLDAILTDGGARGGGACGRDRRPERRRREHRAARATRLRPGCDEQLGNLPGRRAAADVGSRPHGRAALRLEPRGAQPALPEPVAPRPGGERARRAAAGGAGRRLRRPVALLRPRRRVRAGAARAEDGVRAPGGAGARALPSLRGRAGNARADDLPRRGHRAARVVARLQPDARTAGAAVRARPRGLVRDRHPRPERGDRAARRRPPGSRQGPLGARAPGALSA